MQTECDETLKQIIQGFQECKMRLLLSEMNPDSLFCLCCWKETYPVFE